MLIHAQSDSPGKAGGLVSVTASKAVVLLHRQSAMSKEAGVRKALDDRTGISVSQRPYGRLAMLQRVIQMSAQNALRQPTSQVAAQVLARRWRSPKA